VIYAKLLFGGFGRRGLEAITAAVILALTNALVASGLMIITGSYDAMSRAERDDRPDIIRVKARFNRAVFETPRRGNLPPLLLPVYDPLLDPGKLVSASQGAIVLMRQSLLRNVVSPDGFLNIYVFGVEPELERQVGVFSVAQGRFLRSTDQAAAVLDQASANALAIKVGDPITIRKADGLDLPITVVGILDQWALRDAPQRTVEAPALRPEADVASGGILINLSMSQQIFGRPALTDALLIVPHPVSIPAVVDKLQEAFRLEPGVFISERFSRFARKVHDFELSLAFFLIVCGAAAGLAGAFAAYLLHDVCADRRQQHAILIALGFSPFRSTLILVTLGFCVALTGAIAGTLVAALAGPAHFSMPSLMADLGAVEPRLTPLIGGVIAGLSMLAVGCGLTPTMWRLSRAVVAGEITEPAS
jgi:MacB-like protein